MLSWYQGAQSMIRKYPPQHYLNCWLHHFMLFAPNSDPNIRMSQQKLRPIRPDSVFPTKNTVCFPCANSRLSHVTCTWQEWLIPGVSQIRLEGQNWPGKDYNLSCWKALGNVTEYIDWTLGCVVITFPTDKDWTPIGNHTTPKCLSNRETIKWQKGSSFPTIYFRKLKLNQPTGIFEI